MEVLERWLNVATGEIIICKNCLEALECFKCNLKDLFFMGRAWTDGKPKTDVEE